VPRRDWPAIDQGSALTGVADRVVIHWASDFLRKRWGAVFVVVS
jgi:hypothetical protein